MSLTDGIIRDLERSGMPGLVRKRTTANNVSAIDKLHKLSKRSPSVQHKDLLQKLGGKNFATSPSKKTKTLTAPLTQQVDPKLLTDEQKMALQRWKSLTDEQRKDLTEKYNSAVLKKKIAKEEAAYRPLTRQAPSTDYDKWHQWAKQEEKGDSRNNKTIEHETSSGHVSQDSCMVDPSVSIVHTSLLNSTEGKIEAFLSCFLCSWTFCSIILPAEYAHTFIKQVLFGLLIGASLLTDQKGLFVLFCGFLEGVTFGILISHIVFGIQPFIGGLIIGGFGMWLRKRMPHNREYNVGNISEVRR